MNAMETTFSLETAKTAKCSRFCGSSGATSGCFNISDRNGTNLGAQWLKMTALVCVSYIRLINCEQPPGAPGSRGSSAPLQIISGK